MDSKNDIDSKELNSYIKTKSTLKLCFSSAYGYVLKNCLNDVIIESVIDNYLI